MRVPGMRQKLCREHVERAKLQSAEEFRYSDGGKRTLRPLKLAGQISTGARRRVLGAYN